VRLFASNQPVMPRVSVLMGCKLERPLTQTHERTESNM
jgi:hypothetical protein